MGETKLEQLLKKIKEARTLADELASEMWPLAFRIELTITPLASSEYSYSFGEAISTSNH